MQMPFHWPKHEVISDLRSVLMLMRKGKLKKREEGHAHLWQWGSREKAWGKLAMDSCKLERDVELAFAFALEGLHGSSYQGVTISWICKGHWSEHKKRSQEGCSLVGEGKDGLCSPYVQWPCPMTTTPWLLLRERATRLRSLGVLDHIIGSAHFSSHSAFVAAPDYAGELAGKFPDSWA
jgi:hypothetical protein